MAAPVVLPVNQFFDSNGDPLAGGTIETYLRDTSTPKQTWVDPDQSALNTNPIRLDSAGRCIMWADGELRLILRDAAGNEIWDITASTIVSAAMAPVMLAPTIADAVNLLGLGGGSVSDEAAARSAADSAEQTARIAADNALGTRIDNEVTARTAADDNLQTQINTITGGTAPTLVLPAGYSMRFGLTVSDGGGNWSATFSPPFPSACDTVTTACQSSSWWGSVTSRSAGGCGGKTSSPLHGGGFDGGPIGVYFIAIGH
jgi:hypothetical protein